MLCYAVMTSSTCAVDLTACSSIYNSTVILRGPLACSGTNVTLDIISGNGIFLALVTVPTKCWPEFAKHVTPHVQFHVLSVVYRSPKSHVNQGLLKIGQKRSV